MDDTFLTKAEKIEMEFIAGFKSLMDITIGVFPCPDT